MKKLLLPFLTAILLCSQSYSKVWRVNNNPGINANFTTPTAAIASGSVVNGDTLYIEASTADYGAVTISKQLTIIGPGYFLSFGPQLQYNLNAASIAGIIITAPNVKIYGIKSTYLYIYGTEYSGTASNVVVSRCYLGSLNLYGTQNNILGVQNFITGAITTGGNATNLLISNNLVGDGFTGYTGDVGVIEYNVFGIYTATYPNMSFNSGSYTFNNNIIRNGLYGTLFTGTTNSTFAYNMAEANVLPAGNGNQNSVDMSGTSVFVDGSANNDPAANGDSRYQLSNSSLAKTAGAGSTPIGAYAGGSPYRLSGIPAIPTIYALTIPSAMPTGTIVPVTFSSRSNN